MAPSANTRLVRRAGWLVLIFLALTLVSIVSYVLITEDRVVADSEEEQRSEPLVDTSRAPSYRFPTTARSYDASLNRFVDRFIRVCLQGQYSEFRMMYTHRLEPPSAKRFVTIFNAVKEIRLRALEKLPPLPSLPGPVYRLVADYDLQDFAVRHNERTRTIQVAIVREDGEWVIAPLPRGSSAQLAALMAGTTRPANEGTTEGL